MRKMEESNCALVYLDLVPCIVDQSYSYTTGLYIITYIFFLFDSD